MNIWKCFNICWKSEYQTFNWIHPTLTITYCRCKGQQDWYSLHDKQKNRIIKYPLDNAIITSNMNVSTSSLMSSMDSWVPSSVLHISMSRKASLCPLLLYMSSSECWFSTSSMLCREASVILSIFSLITYTHAQITSKSTNNSTLKYSCEQSVNFKQCTLVYHLVIKNYRTMYMVYTSLWKL